MTYIHPLDTLNRKYPFVISLLWKGNVFHPYSIHSRYKWSMLDEIGIVLFKLYEETGIICPKRFAPSDSGAALLGLCKWNLGNNPIPTLSTAGHWEWKVSIGYYTKVL